MFREVAHKTILLLTATLIMGPAMDCCVHTFEGGSLPGDVVFSAPECCEHGHGEDEAAHDHCACLCHTPQLLTDAPSFADHAPCLTLAAAAASTCPQVFLALLERPPIA